jgi:hypothetical protein
VLAQNVPKAAKNLGSPRLHGLDKFVDCGGVQHGEFLEVLELFGLGVLFEEGHKLVEGQDAAPKLGVGVVRDARVEGLEVRGQVHDRGGGYLGLGQQRLPDHVVYFLEDQVGEQVGGLIVQARVIIEHEF